MHLLYDSAQATIDSITMGENKKLFFSTSPKIRLLYPSEVTRIYAVLHKLPVDLTEQYLEKTLPSTIENWKSAEKDAFYTRSLAAIAQSDICMFEASHPSLTLAHFVRFALDQDKPTVVFYHETTTPFLLEAAGDAEPTLCAYSQYNLEQMLRMVIDEALAQPTAIRFNCLISTELNRYISQAAKQAHLSKSEFFRKLVRDHQKSNS